MFDNLTKKLNLNQLSLILLKVFQIDEVLIYPSYHILAQCRVLHRAMNKDLKYNRDAGEVKAKLSYLANSYVNLYKPTKNVLRKYRVLNKLRNNKDILITTPDKGKRVIILDRRFYMSNIYDIVNDESKFLKL